MRQALSLAKILNLREAVRALPTVAVLLLAAAIALIHFDAAAIQRPSKSHGTGGAGYDLVWWTVDGGGTVFSEGSGYILAGTIGQPDTGYLAGGDIILRGGFWHSRGVVRYVLYLPLTLWNY